MEIRKARPEEVDQATRVLLLRRTDVPNGVKRVYADLVARLEASGVSVERQIIAVDDGKIAASCAYPQIDPTAAHVIPPALLPRYPDASLSLRAALIRYAADEARKAGARLVQTILERDDKEGVASFEAGGFELLAELVFMDRAHAADDKALEVSEGLRFAAYNDEREALFLDTIRRTSEGTLDCPRLSALRSPQEILESHRRTGCFEPGVWFLAETDDGPVGVVLLSFMQVSGRFNLTFMGVVPECRGRGFGAQMLRYALRKIAETRPAALSLAVDVRNWPARRIYREAGFAETARKDVYFVSFA